MLRKIATLGALSILVPTLGLADPVNINTADAVTLARALDGVGLSKAEAIVEWRETHGLFDSPEDLVQVKGVGERILQLNRHNILISDPES